MSPTLRDLLARGTPVEWFEAVAIVQALCKRLLDEAPATGVRVPDLHEIVLTADGTIDLTGEGPGRPVARLPDRASAHGARRQSADARPAPAAGADGRCAIASLRVGPGPDDGARLLRAAGPGRDPPGCVRAEPAAACHCRGGGPIPGDTGSASATSGCAVSVLVEAPSYGRRHLPRARSDSRGGRVLAGDPLEGAVAGRKLPAGGASGRSHHRHRCTDRLVGHRSTPGAPRWVK